MGVFKNEVGRPSNEILKKRKIIKIIILSIFILSILSILIIYKPKSTDEQKYKVIYNYNYDVKGKIVYLEKGEKVTELLIERENYNFLGWYLEDQLYDFSKPLKKDIILLAKWTEKKEGEFLIEFDSNGGTQIEKQIVKKDEKILKPENPIKEGYEFKFWTVDDKEYNFDSLVTKELKLIAKYEKINSKENTTIKNNITTGTTQTTSKKKFTVTFNSDGGTFVPTQYLEEGQRIVKPKNPVKPGYVFKYWQSQRYITYFIKDDEILNTVTEDTVLTAKWATPKEYEFIMDVSSFDDQSIGYLGYIKGEFPKGTTIEHFVSDSLNGDYIPTAMYSNDDGRISFIEVPINKTLYYKFNIRNNDKGIDIMTNALELKGKIQTPNIVISKSPENGVIDCIMFDTIGGIDSVEVYTSSEKDGNYKLEEEIKNVNAQCYASWKNSPCAYARIYFPIHKSGVYYKIRGYNVLESGKKYYSDFSNIVYY